MSDRHISVGDLVVVVRRSPCGCGNSIGKVFRVHGIGNNGRENICMHCGRIDPASIVAIFQNGSVCELWRLKRIPPLADLEPTDQQQELTA